MTPARYATLVQLAVFPEIFKLSVDDNWPQLWRLATALGRHAIKYAEMSQYLFGIELRHMLRRVDTRPAEFRLEGQGDNGR